MKKNLLLAVAAFAAIFTLSACRSDDVVEDTKRPFGDAMENPQNGANFDPNAGDGFGPGGNSGNQPGNWVDPNQLANSGDGWVPADPTGKNLNMPVIYFAYDSDVLVPSETANLDKIAEFLNREQNRSLGLVIEGHCDARGTDEYNRALGERRANAIRAYLVKRNVADNRIRTLSFGKDKPAVAGSGESVWRQNRRGVPVPMHMGR